MSKGSRSKTTASRRNVRQCVQGILKSEKFAVLTTQTQTTPYASIICYGVSKDFKDLFFATPVKTRKYRFLQKCAKVAIQMDTRARHQDQLMKIESVTALGLAHLIKAPDLKAQYAKLLLKRQPVIQSFLLSSTTALFRVRIRRYIHVWRFQQIREWKP